LRTSLKMTLAVFDLLVFTLKFLSFEMLFCDKCDDFLIPVISLYFEIPLGYLTKITEFKNKVQIVMPFSLDHLIKSDNVGV